MKKTKIIAIIGEAGSGKDTLMKECLKHIKNLNPIISYTTRPKRENEVDGVDYHFLSNEEFLEKLNNREMLEATVFNEWCYGTGRGSLNPDKVNIGVFNIDGINNLLDYDDIEIYVIYLKVNAKNRLLRQLKREENPNVDEIIRRYQTDKKDFTTLPFVYHTLENNKPSDIKSNIEVIRKIRTNLNNSI